MLKQHGSSLAKSAWYIGRTSRVTVASEAFEKFRRSMSIGCAEWHDGIGYDLEALAGLPPEERQRAEDLVVGRHAADWRDVEALDHIGSERTLAELAKAIRSRSVEIRVEAAQRLARRKLLSESEIDKIIVDALAHTTILNGMVKTLSFATAYPTTAVRSKLLWCALHGNDEPTLRHLGMQSTIAASRILSSYCPESRRRESSHDSG